MESLGCFLLRGTSKAKRVVSYENIKSIAFNALIWISLTTEKAVHKILDLTGLCEDPSTHQLLLCIIFMWKLLLLPMFGVSMSSTDSCKAGGNTHIQVHATCSV